MSGPLTGVRVLDLTSIVMGPYATLILGDLGADVIKVEPLEGDVSRQSVPRRSPNMGHAFLNSNRNKRSIAIDLKHPDGRAALLALARRADVLVHNNRPQAMARLKLAYEDVVAANSQIIYVGAFGFGQRGPYAARPAYDDVIQGLIGLPSLAGIASGREPRYAPHAYADRTSALHVAIAVLGALYHRKCSGNGQRVDVPMFENLVHGVLGEHIAGETFIPAEGPMGHLRTLSRDRRPYKTKDGYLGILIYTDKQWRRFFELIGKPEMFASDKRFSSQIERNRNIEAVCGYLSEIFVTRTTADWLPALAASDIPAGPINSLEDVLNDEHLSASGYFSKSEHPTEGLLRLMLYPTEWSATPAAHRLHAPRLGEHTAELLREAGYAQSAIDALVSQRVAICAPGEPD